MLTRHSPGGTLRQLAWSPDGSELYLQTADGPADAPVLYHFTIAREGGALTPVAAQPDWAVAYWNVKQAREAPGLADLAIEVAQKTETIKGGVGPSGLLDRSGDAASIASSGPDPENLAAGSRGNRKAWVVRLSVLGQEVAVFVDERKPAPGTRFSWGPEGSGALVFLDEDGALAYVQRAGRRAYAVSWMAID